MIFFLLDYNCLIEYDGQQHYIYTQSEKSWNTKEQLENTLKHDKIKNNYAQKHNFILIRIPYTRYNDLCLNDLLPETSNFLFKSKILCD